LCEELTFGVPSGGVETLTVSPSGRQAVVAAFQGPEWYYELLALHPKLTQLGSGHELSGYYGDAPTYSPDERYLVTVAGPPGPLWWSPDNEVGDENAAPPSEGGPHDIGTICVHDLAANRVTEHRMVVELPVGWRPEEDLGGWSIVWGPVF